MGNAGARRGEADGLAILGKAVRVPAPNRSRQVRVSLSPTPADARKRSRAARNKGVGRIPRSCVNISVRCPLATLSRLEMIALTSA